MSADRPRVSMALAITGASGALYATRTLAALLASGMAVELAISDYGKRLLKDELGEGATDARLFGATAVKSANVVAPGSMTVHSSRDLGATIASGSHACRG